MKKQLNNFNGFNNLTLENNWSIAEIEAAKGYRLRVRQNAGLAGAIMEDYVYAFGSIAHIVSGWDTPATTWARKCRAVMGPDEYNFIKRQDEKTKEIITKTMARFYWLESEDSRTIDLPLVEIERRIRIGMEI